MNGLRIEGLRVETRIGIHEWEQKIDQLLLIDIDIPLDFNQIDDCIENTVDYAKLCQYVTESVRSQSFQLIESVAKHVSTIIQMHFQAKGCTVRVSKPHAVHHAQNISVLYEKK